MLELRRRWWRGLPALFLAVAPLHAQQQGDELSALYTRGMAEFQAGEYAKAAADLESLSLKAEATPQLEPVFFTLGSAWFNAGDFKKAIAAFQNYGKKFPRGTHLPEATFAIAQCNLSLKNYADAASGFASLENDPRLREQALFSEATALKEENKIDQAIAALEKLAGGDMRTPLAIRAATTLAQLYAQKGNSDKSIALIRKLRTQAKLVDNIVELNATTIEQGDALFKQAKYAAALECYRAAFSREQIIQMQKDRITAMQRNIDANLASARSDPTQFTELAAENNQLKADMAHAQSLLGELEKMPSVTPAIYVRMARCFDETDRKWEAIVVYQEILDRFPKAAEREPALFGLILALADVNQAQKAQARCEQYLREFKTGPNANTVGYLLGAMALQANDAKAAESYFGRALTTQPKSTFREQMRYLLANAKLQEGKYDEANDAYQKYLGDFPKGQYVEDAHYRMALTQLFAGKYENAMNALRDYISKNPRGSYITDARYRLAVCKYAASLYDEVIRDCKDWQADYPDNQQLGEVLALLGDAYAATGRDDDAVQAYIRSYKIAATEEVTNYSLNAASKLLQKKGDWPKLAELYNQFINEKPDSPTVLTALYWIGKAKAHEGKTDEAKQITADTIKKYINDPAREQVELLLTQLAQLCVRKKTPADQSATATPTPTPAPDPGVELDHLLGATEQNATGKARVLYAKAELARLRRNTAEEERNIAEIAKNFQPDDLSPVLLGRAGDYLLAQNQPDRAATFYQRLMDEYPKSDSIDYAYNGLGEIALQKHDLLRALKYFTDGTDKIAASTKLKDLTIGKAKTLFDMGRFVEAKKAFEQIASVREWRGESTAYAVYELGEIEAKRNHWAEANAYFQRVYVGYQKFLPWVAKAYVRSAECFEKLGKQQEAVNTYRELLRNEKLANFAEAAEAKKKLESMGQQG
ncbi:MAG: tetratricopeptide repeat protein [Verrucomicrobia bacterium]|nr:tetratricopeptide repeat protein [Verrucomicrobiota bacterium]